MPLEADHNATAIDAIRAIPRPVEELSTMREKVKGLPKAEGYRVVTRIAEESVRALKDGHTIRAEESKVEPRRRNSSPLPQVGEKS
jgi:hypothetical protein